MSVDSSIDKSNLIEELTNISNLYRQSGDAYRASAFSKAATAISTIPNNVLDSNPSKKELTKYRNIGPSSADAIIEYIRTGEATSRLEQARQSLTETQSKQPEEQLTNRIVTGEINTESSNSSRQEVVSMFKRIHGVGPVTAKKWYDCYGWRTIGDLRENIGRLTRTQRIGLENFSDTEQRIPREEIAHYEETLTYLLPDINWIIAGSYRRGSPDSGDIDLLVQRSSESDQPSSSTASEQITIDVIVDRLRRSGSLIDTLSSGDTKFMGYVRT